MNAVQFSSVLLLAMAQLGCAAETSEQPVAPGVAQLGLLEPGSLRECSGVVASLQYPGIFWVHNDGGDKKPKLYAVTRPGKSVATFRLSGMAVQDWEDIARDDDHHLYIGDLGNNEGRRKNLAVYQCAEPNPNASPTEVTSTRAWRLEYPAAPFDCESLFIYKSHGYVVSKVTQDRRAEVYRFPLEKSEQPVTLEFVTRLAIDSPVTGADLSPGHEKLALVAKNGAYVYPFSGNFTGLERLRPYHVRFREKQIEGCCFVPDGLLATAESREIFLFTDAPFRPAKSDARP